MSQDLNQRVVLITGASAGIGRSTALALASIGAHVYALGRNRSDLDNLYAEAQTQGINIQIVVADVADPVQIQLAIKALSDVHGQVDILLNNAGVMYLSPMKEVELHDWTTMIQTNLIGTLNTIHAVLPGMVAQGCGDILNFSSISARLIGPGTAVYAASKKSC